MSAGKIEIVSEDVVEWVVPYPEKNADVFRSPKFFVDAYEANLEITRNKAELEFFVSVMDPDKVLKLSRVTIALVDDGREKIVFSDSVEDFYEEFIDCDFKISPLDVARFRTLVRQDDGSSVNHLRFRCSYEVDPIHRRLPSLGQHPLGDGMKNFLRNSDFSDCSLVFLN